MSIERTYHCDAPDCESHGKSATPPPYIPWGFIETREIAGTDELKHHFCSWDCVMKYAAQIPPPERIEVGPPEEPGSP